MKRFVITMTLFLASVIVGANAYASCGINIDPANPQGFPTPASIQGVGWVRIEFKDCTLSNDPADPLYRLDNTIAAYQGIISGYASAGIKTLLIIDYMSYPSATSDPDGFGIRAGLIAQGLGSSVTYQIWNEPDIGQGGSLSSSEYSELLNSAATQIKASAPGAKVITAGLASGQASYLNGVDLSNVDGVAFHPYGKVPDGSTIGNTGPLGPAITEYANAAGGKPLWISEIGLNSADQAVQAQYLEKFFAQTNSDSRITNTLWFAWGDGMVSPFGIVTTGGAKKQSYNAFFSSGCGASPPSTIQNQPAIEIQIDPGVSCSAGGGSHGRSEVPRTIIGRVISSKTFTDDITGATKTQVPVENARICVYQGSQTGSDGIGETITVYETSGTTNEDGYFSVDSYLRFMNPAGLTVGVSYYGNNYIGILCGNDIHEVFQIDMNSLQQTPLSQKYWIGMKQTIVDKIITKSGATAPKYPRDFLWELNNEILTPIEMTLKCDPNPPNPDFSGDTTEPPWKQPAEQFETGVKERACPAELLYADRSGETEGDCGPGKLLAQPQQTFEHRGTFELQQPPDDSKKNKSILGPIITRLFGEQGGRDKPQKRYEGITDTRGFYKNPEEESNIMTFLYGGLGAAMQGGTFWPTKGTPNPDLVQCEFLKQGNQMVNTNSSSTSPQLNAQSVANFVLMLRQPVNTKNPQSLENFYLKMNKLNQICYMEDGTLVRLYQIKPPSLWESYYARMTEKDREDYCALQGIPQGDCLEDIPAYTTCNPGEAGCRYLLGVEYFPYSLVAKNMGGSAGMEYYEKNTSEGNSYSPKEGARRRDFFVPENTDTYNIEDGAHLRAVNEPATPAHGWDFSAPSILRLTTPEAIIEAPPLEGVGEPSLMSLAPVTGLESGVLETQESPHKSIKGFDHCMISLLDGDRRFPFTHSFIVKEPSTPQEGQAATNFNIDVCQPTMNGGVPDSNCDTSTNPIDFYALGDIRGLLGGIVASLFNIFARFQDPSAGACTSTGPSASCVKGTPGCVCTADCGNGLCYSGCMGNCTMGTACDSYCSDQCCSEVCTIQGEEVYDCSGTVDSAETKLLSSTSSQDLSGAIETANGIAAMILPPYLLEKGEFGTRESLCTVDMFINQTTDYSSENSMGIERPCSEYTSVMEAARQAVSIPGSNKL